MDPHINPASGVWDDNYANNKGAGGTPAVGSEPAYPTMADIGGSAVDFAKTADAPQNTALADYMAVAKAQPKPLDIYNGLESAAGIPQLRKTSTTLQGQVNDLEDAINKVEPTVTATTQNSLVTEGQRTGMVNAQKYPLTQQLTPMSTALSRLEGSINSQEAGINNQVGYAVQGNQQALDPYKTSISVMGDQAARLVSGFTSDRETELSILMDKVHRGQQLNDQEKAQANALAMEKQRYSDELGLQSAKNTTATDPLGLFG